MSIMAESGHAENDVYSERPAATRVSTNLSKQEKPSLRRLYIM